MTSAEREFITRVWGQSPGNVQGQSLWSRDEAPKLRYLRFSIPKVELNLAGLKAFLGTFRSDPAKQFSATKTIRGKICPPQSPNCQNWILHISKIGNVLPVCIRNNSLRIETTQFTYTYIHIYLFK